MNIKEEIEKTYENFRVTFLKEKGESLEHLEMSEVRDQFKQWIDLKSNIFTDMIHAEDSFLYIYHFTELQEIRRKSIYLQELRDQNFFYKFMQEFFDDNSPSGLQELKVHQINNESDKIWYGKGESNEIIQQWRRERFKNYL
ncbi:MAG: hypothetical protein ISR28_05700 [SAR86 cluster bacterium]|nr:hypothetical protein [SAR86 cluster bacterium]|tara:strand:+ start:2037 stop:2462 length:426 start_codon:yes stop_codon:yes gene_type:complete